MAEGNNERENQQKMGYRSPESVSRQNYDQPGSSAFPSEQQQRQAAGTTLENATPLREDNASNPGLAPDRSGTYPGPGTATDRGTGNVGSTPYGTGISDNGFESTSGLDERNTSGSNSAGYNLSDDVGNPLSDSGVTGSDTPGRDNQFSEMGTGEGDFSSRPTDTGASSR